MKIVKPKSLEEFLSLFYDLYDTPQVFKYYRGQADYSWDITPGLARNKGIKNNEDLFRIEIKLIENFKNKIAYNKFDYLVPLGECSYDKSWIYLMAAQHYGLSTRLMDFTCNKYVALEFAVADLNHLNKDGVLIIYNDIESIQEDVDSSILKNPVSQSHHTFFFQGISFRNSKNNECNLSESRKIIQCSKFLYRDSHNLFKCLTLDELHRNHLTIVHIPKNLKLEIINYFVKKNSLVFDLYRGRNILDFYAKILNNEFQNINDSRIDDYLKSDNI
jgi:hypothetical protein